MKKSQYKKFTAHIREENTPEYKQFKAISKEDDRLIEYLQQSMELDKGDKVLDIGGREGYISLAIQDPEDITIVDPDPTLKLLNPQATHVTSTIQEFDMREEYELIICSHVMGDLGRDDAQEVVVSNLLDALTDSGHLVLSYNTNTGLMADLLNLSLEHLSESRYDYFQESILSSYVNLDISRHDFGVSLDYGSFEGLARCCWVLFGTAEQNIKEVADVFLPFLKKNLDEPSFVLEERILDLTHG